MGKYSPSYYSSGIDPVVTNANGEAARLTVRGQGNELLEVTLQKKYDDLGHETIEAVGGIKTNMKDPAEIEAAVNQRAKLTRKPG